MWRSKRAVGQVWRAVEPGEDGESRDARLVAGLRRGSPGAFAGLHEEYAAGIYTLALRMVRHAPDAEDITQDVLIRAYERLPREREVLLRPWLYRLTINRCYDHLRAAARRRPATPAGGLSGRSARSGDGHGAETELASPVDLFEQSELQRLFEAALRDLTPRQRAALLLKDVHGLTLVEVAACLELTSGSVEVLLARARKAFRASFEGHCRAAGRPAPSSAGLLAGLPALPLYPLPPGLLAPLALPTVLPTPVSLPPVAAGGGIGAALCLPASLKTAVLIVAAAATVSTAEVAVTRGEAPPVKRPVAVVPATGAAPAVGHACAAAPSPRPGGSARAAVISPSPAATVAAAPAPSPTASADPSASLGISSLTPTPDAAPSASPTARATPEPSPSPSPVPSVPPPSPSSSPIPSP
jgi:RNA polymerase sigma factor (sigma-70 family)